MEHALLFLEEAAKIPKENPTLKLSVEGHTDAIGSDEYNLKLSLRRAAAVKAFLVQEDVEGPRLTTRGESQPVAINDTDEDRAQNRRVDLKVVE